MGNKIRNNDEELKGPGKPEIYVTVQRRPDQLKVKREMLKMLGRDERNEVQEFGVTYGQGRQSGHGFV